MPFRRGPAASLFRPLALGALAAFGMLAACSLAVSTSGLSNGPTDTPATAADGATDHGEPVIADAGEPDATADASSDARVFPPEAQIWPINGHGYAVYVVAGGVTWTAAKTRAEAAGGHLATIGSPEENELVKSIVTARSDAFSGLIGPWLGASQPSPTALDEPAGGWQWVDATPWGFTDWVGSQPDNSAGNESYLDFYKPSGVLGWNDDAIGGTGPAIVGYVVEYE